VSREETALSKAGTSGASQNRVRTRQSTRLALTKQAREHDNGGRWARRASEIQEIESTSLWQIQVQEHQAKAAFAQLSGTTLAVGGEYHFVSALLEDFFQRLSNGSVIIYDEYDRFHGPALAGRGDSATLRLVILEHFFMFFAL
jgi:hypothetical protein